MRRGTGMAMLFAAAAVLAAWTAWMAWMAWPRTSASLATPVDRVFVITMAALLAGLPLLARPFLGPAGNRVVLADDPTPGRDDPRHGGGGSPGPEPAPDPPDGGLQEPDPDLDLDLDLDRLVTALAEAELEPAGLR